MTRLLAALVDGIGRLIEAALYTWPDDDETGA